MQDSASTTRTFKAAYAVTLDNAVLEAHDHLLAISGYGAELTATLDGSPCTLEEAERITRLALSLGTWERLSGPSLTPTIGTKRAHAMHIELGKRGYPTNHADLASGVLNRDVRHLRDLTESEARTVWTCLIHGAGVAA